MLELERNDSCVYIIKNKTNGKFYIGSTNHFRFRKNEHLSLLRRGVHANKHLQSAFNLYGEENFFFQKIITCEPEMLLDLEQESIDLYKPEYNICIDATRPNKRIYSKEEREKVSREHKGKIISEYTRNLISTSHKGVKLSSEHIKGIIESHKGKKPSESAIDASSKLYSGFIAPDGTVYKDIFNLNKFCREHELTSTSMYYISKGLRKQHKGWKALNIEKEGN